MSYAAGMVDNPIDYALDTLRYVQGMIGQDKRVTFAIMALEEYVANKDEEQLPDGDCYFCEGVGCPYCIRSPEPEPIVWCSCKPGKIGDGACLDCGGKMTPF